ncbi:MAG TPA: beta-ketoacyl-[acyl-carrier-protein] synthase family protein [Planctomycetota bacterium]|nr:beta-ketoacyl-[acyl-carrier-protein] synthase family protein [Planctomycetota bacterium]
MSPAERHPPAITGVGLVTAFGPSAAVTWSAVRTGRSAVRTIELDGTRVLAASVPTDDDPAREPNIVMALDAAHEAVTDAGITPRELAGTHTGCTLSSSKGGMKSFFRLHRAFLEGEALPADFWQRVSPASPGRVVAGELGITGPVVNYAAACATGIHAVIAAVGLITSGKAEVVLAGATDASVVQPIIAAFDRMGVLSRRYDDPEGACRPFDRTRDGFAVGEGAVVLVLESARRAREKPERVYAHVTGSAWGTDAYDVTRLSTRHSEIGPLIGRALADAGRSAAEVDYVNAHGTGTVANDRIESAAIRDALGEETRRVPVSSLKGAIGHLLGAAGGTELALTLLALRDGFVPPTRNLNDPDPECELNHVVGTGIERELKLAVKVAAGFGGHVGVVVVERGGRRG